MDFDSPVLSRIHKNHDYTPARSNLALLGSRNEVATG